MRLRILSRASDLARLQATLVGRALAARWPDLDIVYLTRVASGDRDGVTPLAAMPDKGAFTADLSDALASGAAECVVHSWKDLPLEGRPDTVIAATLERGDPRDVLVMRRDAAEGRPRRVRLLTSSPRREWLLSHVLPSLLPWPVDEIACEPVRGNIQTRLTRLMEGRGDALVVAKAALDRLLLRDGTDGTDGTNRTDGTNGTDGIDGGHGALGRGAAAVRAVLDQCRLMVLPLRDVPGAPAQGALAVEVSLHNAAVRERVEAICHQPTWDAVMAERRVLAAHGGGCHEAVGATAMTRDYGRVMSVKAKTGHASQDSWTLEDGGPAMAQVPAAGLFPRRDERDTATRQTRPVAMPADIDGLWIARADALPASWALSPDQPVWAAGGRTWRRLAARGIWVNGCADGLGDLELPSLDLLAGRPISWLRLTHEAATDAGALATYVVEETLPDDLPSRTHFFWTSGRLFERALTRWPELANRHHACGPGRTWRTLRAALPAGAHLRVRLDYDQWHKEILG